MSINTDTDQYMLQVGDKDALRLKVMNQILNKGSIRFLKDFIHPGMTVLEIGCGIGIMTLHLAEIVGENGKVIAIDNSTEQLEQARKMIAHTPIADRIILQHSDFKNFDANDHFDASYSRYVGIHLKRPKDLLEAHYKHIKPGGISILEEASCLNMRTYPETPLFEESKHLYHKASIANGVDSEYGEKLIPDAIDTGFIIEDANECVPLPSREKSIEYIKLAHSSMAEVLKKQDKEAYERVSALDPDSMNFSYGKFMSLYQLAVRKAH